MTAKKNTGPVQLGEVMGDLLAQAQARAALPPPKRQTKKITPTGLILTEADQKLIGAGAEIATTERPERSGDCAAATKPSPSAGADSRAAARMRSRACRVCRENPRSSPAWIPKAGDRW